MSGYGLKFSFALFCIKLSPGSFYLVCCCGALWITLWGYEYELLESLRSPVINGVVNSITNANFNLILKQIYFFEFWTSLLHQEVKERLWGEIGGRDSICSLRLMIVCAQVPINSKVEAPKPSLTPEQLKAKQQELR